LKLLVAASLVVGLALMTAVIGYFGFEAVGAVFLSAGWGMVVLAFYQGLSIVFAALAWRVVARSVWRGPFRLFVWARWIREGVNTLMPVGQVGGDIVGARLLAVGGSGAALGGAATVVDKTIEVLTEFVFCVAGVGLLLVISADKSTGWSVALGLLIFCPLLVGFVVAQRMGMFRVLERFLLRLEERTDWLRLGDVSGLHDTILLLYRDRRAVWWGAVNHLVTWVLGIGELWLAVHFMGHEVTLLAAAVIESLSQAVRSAGFVIPGSLGVQEGGYLLFGTMMGLSPEVALALSLVRRVRHLLVGIPALLAWQIYEGRRLVAVRRKTPSSER